MSSILSHVSAIALQAQQLREELMRDEPRFALLQELERIQARFQKGAGGEPEVTVAVASRPYAAPAVRKSRADPNSLRQRVIAAVEEFLAGKTTPTPVADIYNHVVGLGLEIGGRDPRSNLSATLWKAGPFQAQGRAGWMLRSSQNNEAADTNQQGGTSTASVEPRLISEETHPVTPVNPVRGGGG
ncbi:MAG: hypothetical protein KIT43_04530 [Bauldia sp.]|nr:hypothetical protein [Bauldia sp.]MCW5717949.1 hypothetical protein [Bauldia sp.]